MGIVLQSASGVTSALLTTLVAVAVFAAGGFVLVRWLSGRGGRWVRRHDARLQVVERVPLDFKSSLYLVRGMGRTWLVGCGDHGAPRLLAELEDETAQAAEHTPGDDGRGDG